MKITMIPKTKQSALHEKIASDVEVGSQLDADDFLVYSGIVGIFYKHNTVKHSAGIELWALLKQGLTGTYHNVSVKHLPRHIGKFVFRLNEGSCEIDMADRMEALAKGFGGKRIRYKDLIK